MTEATYQNIRKLSSVVFTKKQRLQFAPAQKFNRDQGVSTVTSITSSARIISIQEAFKELSCVS